MLTGLARVLYTGATGTFLNNDEILSFLVPAVDYGIIGYNVFRYSINALRSLSANLSPK